MKGYDRTGVIKRWRKIQTGDGSIDTALLENCDKSSVIYAMTDADGNYTSLRIECHSSSVASYTMNPDSDASFSLDDVDPGLTGYVFVAGFFFVLPLYAVAFGLNALLKVIGYR